MLRQLGGARTSLSKPRAIRSECAANAMLQPDVAQLRSRLRRGLARMPLTSTDLRVGAAAGRTWGAGCEVPPGSLLSDGLRRVALGGLAAPADNPRGAGRPFRRRDNSCRQYPRRHTRRSHPRRHGRRGPRRHGRVGAGINRRRHPGRDRGRHRRFLPCSPCDRRRRPGRGSPLTTYSPAIALQLPGGPADVHQAEPTQVAGRVCGRVETRAGLRKAESHVK